MAIIEELVAKLSFEITGLKDLEDVSGKLDTMRKTVAEVADSAKGKLSTALAGLGEVAAASRTAADAGGGLPAVLKGIAEGASSLASVTKGTGLGAALEGVAGNFGTLTSALEGGFATAILAAGAVVLDFISKVGGAAQKHRTDSLEAKGKGTTANKIEALTNTLREAAGTSPDKAPEWVDNVIKATAKILVEARAGSAEAKQQLDSLGLCDSYKPNADGTKKDTADVAEHVFKRRKELQDRADAADKDHDNPFAASLGENTRKQIKQIDEKFGIKDGLRGLLEEASVNALEEAKRRAETDKPPLDSERNDRTTDVAKGYAELSVKLQTLGGAFDDIANRITKFLLPPVNLLATAFLELAKWLGLVNRGEEEIARRKKEDDERKAAFAAKWNASEGLEDKRSDAERRARTENDPIARLEAELEEDRSTAEKIKQEQARGIDYGGLETVLNRIAAKEAELAKLKGAAAQSPGQPATVGPQPPSSSPQPAMQPQSGPPPALEEWWRRVIETLPQITASISGEYNINKAIRDKQTQSESKTDNRQYSEIGNDKRTVTNNVTVNATGLREVAAAAQRGVVTASAMVKGSNASTAALTAA